MCVRLPGTLRLFRWEDKEVVCPVLVTRGCISSLTLKSKRTIVHGKRRYLRSLKPMLLFLWPTWLNWCGLVFSRPGHWKETLFPTWVESVYIDSREYELGLEWNPSVPHDLILLWLQEWVWLSVLDTPPIFTLIKKFDRYTRINLRTRLSVNRFVTKTLKLHVYSKR